MAAAILEGAGPAVSVVRPDPQTGRLVRAVVRKPAPADAQPAHAADPALASTVDRVAEQTQLSPKLIDSVIRAESNYNPNAVSPKGAQGLMQLIPSTARRFGVADVFDPVSNIEGGARYLSYLLQLYKGDGILALAAYNAGEGAVARYGGVPPYRETQDYVSRIQKRLENAAVNETAAQVPGVQTIEAKPAGANPAEVHHPIQEVTDAHGKVYYISTDAR